MYQPWLEDTLRQIHNLKGDISPEHNRQVVGGFVTESSVVQIASGVLPAYNAFQHYILELAGCDTTTANIVGDDLVYGVWFMYPQIYGDYTEDVSKMHLVVELLTYGMENDMRWICEFPPSWSSNAQNRGICSINQVTDSFEWEFSVV